MRRASATIDSLSRLTPETRIFVTLTLAEASAVVQLQPADVAAVRALAKIRTALEGATPITPAGPVPPLLRAKHWRPRDTSQHFRMAKAGPRPPVSIDTPPAPELDDYVPFRDEAGGAYT